MLVTEKLERQPNFPREDLSATNAKWLSMAIGNRDILHKGHTFAENHYRIFRATHRSLAMAANNLYETTDANNAINFGIKAFEAITLLVSAEESEANLDILQTNITGIISIRNRNGVTDYFEEAHETFLHEAPRTAETIYEGASRYHEPRLAILGGAIARQFEIDNTL